MSDTDDKYLGAMLEEIRDQNKAILELVEDVPGIKQKLGAIESDVSELKSDMKIVKAAVTDHSRQLRDHEHRISDLEAA